MPDGGMDASGDERVRCLHCSEAILPGARVCPYCRNSALIRLVATSPLDERTRYQLARSLVGARLPGSPPLAVFVAGLRETPPCLISGVTQDEASPAIAAARTAGVEVRVEPPTSATGVRPASSPPWSAVVGLAILAGAIAAYAMWPGTRERIEPAPRATVARAPLASPSVTIAVLPQDLMQSVVALRCGNQAGAGFFVALDLVLTNAHVLCEKEDVILVSMSDGRKTLGKVERRDPYLDLGLVRVSISGAPPRPLPVHDAAGTALGSRVFFGGSPSGLDFTFHEGRISRVGQPVLGLAYLQIDARVNPGNSGGPLFDEEGRVIGVVSMKMEGEGLGLALPINYAFDAVDHPFLPVLDGWVPSEAFQQLAAAAKMNSAADEEKLAGAMARPAIVRIRNDPYGRPLILMGRLAKSEPPSEDFPLEFRYGREVLCRRTVHAARWNEELQPLPLPPRMSAWLKEQKLTLRLFTTEVSPGLSGCPAFQNRRVSIVLAGE